MFSGWAVGAALRLLGGGMILAALTTAAHAEAYMHLRVDQAQAILELPDNLSPGSGLRNFVAVSGGAPVKSLLVPAVRPERWRFALDLSSPLAYSPFKAYYKPIGPAAGDGMTAVRSAGGALLLSWQNRQGSFGAALRIRPTGAIGLVVDHAARPRGGVRAGTGLLPYGIPYQPQPAPVPLPLPGVALLGALGLLGALRRPRRRS